MQKVVTLTVNPAIDKSAEADSVIPEIKIRCEAPSYDPGGGGVNVSRAIKKLGGASIAVYAAGGSTGQLLYDLLASEEIEQAQVQTRGLTRENLTIYERNTGLQYRFGMPGSELSAAEWQDCIDTVMRLNADLIVSSGSLCPGVPVDFYARLAQQANRKGIRIIVDTSGPALSEAVQQGVFLIKPNLRELEVFSGAKIQGDDHLRAVAGKLIAEGLVEAIAVSMGAGGATLITADNYINLRAPMVPIQSKVGAGDSMVGGVAYALAQGNSILESVKYGVAAGTAAVMTPGTRLCRREDVDHLYKQIAVIPK